MIALRVLVKVQDLVVLAESVAIEVPIRIVEQRVLRVLVGQVRVSFYCLSERCGVLEREPFLAERVAILHPLSVSTGRCSTMSFVYENKIVAFEGIDRNGLLAHILTKLRHLHDLDRSAREQPTTVLSEQLRFDARKLELAQVL